MVDVAKFWSWVTISLSKENFDQIFSSPRFRHVNTVYFNLERKLSELQMATFFSGLEDSALIDLSCNCVRLASVDAETLGQVVVKVKNVQMAMSSLTLHQVQVMFKAIADCEGIKLTHLNICGNDLSQIPPSILAQAIVRLEEADMFLTRLTSVQVEAIVNSIILTSQRGGLKLKRLSIRKGDISTVSETTAQQVKRILRLFLWQ